MILKTGTLFIDFNYNYSKIKFMPDKNSSEADDNTGKENVPIDKDEHVKEAYEQAEKDIERDHDQVTDEDKDLDEGELARKESHP